MQMKTGDWPRTVCRFAAMVIVTCGTIALPAVADDVHGPQKPGATLEERIAAGDLEYRDARTGEVVVATRERIDALRSDLERHFGQPPVYNEKVSPDGAVVSVIGDAIRDVHLMRINLDGTRTTACLRELDAAVAFIVGLDTVETEAAHNAPSAAKR